MADESVDKDQEPELGGEEWHQIMLLELTEKGAVRISLFDHTSDFSIGGAMRFAQTVGQIVRDAHRDGKGVEVREEKRRYEDESRRN